MTQRKPLIAVPTGDPAGVGPEIAAKACALEKVYDAADVIAIGDRKVMENAIRIVGADLRVNVVDSPAAGDYQKGVLNLIDLDNIDQARFSYGTVQAMCGKAAYAYIEKSIRLAMEGEADAVATTPINKEALHAAEVPFIGHTEIFGALTGTPDPLTMFETNGLRVFFLTRHKSLRAMLDDITKDNIKACVKESLAALRRLGVTEGTMAVAGLNPHCGEHG
ncbi:MAG: 4-hydroxythreonine-4-phosphate dehydrogenase PdxA, partial [Eubacteriales bacterium]|nr:4-hydroxythreonine-4-phosphate dehydrogenase PdxA [Eubacteriales bacterium]